MAKSEEIPNRPATPVVIRFLGCDAEMVGVNQDFFTIGDAADCDVAFPEVLKSNGNTIFRIGRAADGWRLHCPSGGAFYLNQEVAARSVGLRSGDVIRLVPGGPGLQFNILSQNSEPLSKLTARYAPRLAQSTSDPTPMESIPAPTASSKPKVGPIGKPSRDSNGSKNFHSNSRFPPKWIHAMDYPKSTILFLVAVVALLASIAALTLWPGGESLPSNDTTPPVDSSNDTES